MEEVRILDMGNYKSEYQVAVPCMIEGSDPVGS